MRFLSSFFLLFALLFGGCGSSKKLEISPVKNTIPDWYQNPPLSDTRTLYAVGEGKDKQEAIANALSYMASTLSVSIKSSYRAKTTVREGSVTTQEGVYNSDIASDVKKIRISNYDVIESETLGFKKVAVLVRSDKTRLFNSLQQELDQMITLAESKEKNLKDDPLGKYLFYKELKKQFRNVPNTLIVMKELRNSFDNAKYLRTLSSIDKKYNYYQSHISFSVRSNISNLHTPVEKALSKRSFQVKATRSNMHYTITIDTSVSKANAYGFTLARAELHILTKNARGVIIASNVVHLTGQSSQGYKVALQDLVRQFSDKITQEGLDKVLNINI